MPTGRVLAVIPARAGSKSVMRKNIRPLGGVPLLAYSIAAARQSTLVDRVIVSTDDNEIAAAAKQNGAEVPFLRPASLGQDSTPDLPVFQHALQWLREHDNWVPDVVVQLRPTSPFRPPCCVDTAIRLLREDDSADSIRAVARASENPYKMWRLQDDGRLTALLDDRGPEAYNKPRQELPISYWQTGHLDVCRTATIVDGHSMSGNRINGLVIDSQYACDIDSERDWEMAEWMLQRFDGPLIRPESPDPLPAVIRLIVFDFDGVFTDNRVWVTATGEESVACSRADGLGLEHLRQLGVPMLVLSKEKNPVVSARCRKVNIECEQSVADKLPRLDAVLAERHIDRAEVIYVGNDVNDLECMRAVGCGVAVADAHPAVLREADLILRKPGGYGAIRELCDRVAARLQG